MSARLEVISGKHRPRFGWRPPSRRKALMMLMVAVLMVAGLGYFKARYRIGLDNQILSCMVEDVFLIDRWDRTFQRGDLVSFAADTRMAPYFPLGHRIVKRVVGLPGDGVSIVPVPPDPTLPSPLPLPGEREALGDRPRHLFNYAVRVNGEPHGRGGLNALYRTGGDPADYVGERIVPEGHFFVLGDTAASFDSRYWGPLPADRITGKVYALW
jgi:type IV secretory pathway protease TraF